jgi:hypothetical protein
VIERAALPGATRITDQQKELVGVMQGRFDPKVGAAADQRAAADQQLGEDRDRVGLGVRRDLGDELAGQPVERLEGRSPGLTERCRDRTAR